jgi:hypothetical protein
LAAHPTLGLRGGSYFSRAYAGTFSDWDVSVHYDC